MDAFQFANLCRALLNIDRAELEAAGVLTPGKTDDGGTSWKRFNDDWRVFVCKLDDNRLQSLWNLIAPEPTKEEVDARVNLIETLRAAKVYCNVANIAAAHQSNRQVLEHSGQIMRQIDKALVDLDAPTEIEIPENGQAQ